jgi:c-di-GMP-binding flagellar brake protein YcgR
MTTDNGPLAPVKNHPGFEDIKLQVGARLQLMLARSQKTIYYSALIGYVPGEYLLVKIPIDHGLSVPMQEGEHLTVRVFSGVAVYTFNCVVESILLAPRYYMHLSFPKTVQATPLRDAARVKVNMPVEIKRAAGVQAQPTTAKLSDLSVSGAFISADGELGEPGDNISVAFTFHVQPTNQEVHIETSATIRSCRVLNGSGNSKANESTPPLHGAGIRFNDISANELVMLQNFLYEVNGNPLHS